MNRLSITRDSATTAQYRDGRAVPSFPFRFHVFEIIYTVQQLEKPAIFHFRSKNLEFEIGFQKFSGILISEYLLQSRVDTEKLALAICTVNSIRRVFNHGPKISVSQTKRFES